MVRYYRITGTPSVFTGTLEDEDHPGSKNHSDDTYSQGSGTDRDKIEYLLVCIMKYEDKRELQHMFKK